MLILRLVAAFTSQSARSFPKTPACPRTNAKSIEVFLSFNLLSCFWISKVMLFDEQIHLRESKENDKRAIGNESRKFGPRSTDEDTQAGYPTLSFRTGLIGAFDP
ncbi:hypothetical protein TNCV_3100921 [Trichonephila clavipes]|nr:hypothetical protein TNCV_3100921 [Trichonephila clavipes]